MSEINLVRQTITKVSPMSTASFQQVVNLIEFDVYEAGSAFIKRGQTNDSEYFLLNGVCRSYLLNVKEEPVTISLYMGTAVLTPHVIRSENRLSNLSFEALTPVTLGMVNAEAFLQLMIENIEVREFANRALQQELLEKTRKEINLVSLTAQQRLEQLRTDFPNIENLVPHQVIASYLGITHVSLSRLRGTSSRK